MADTNAVHKDDAHHVVEYFESLGWTVIRWRHHSQTPYVFFRFYRADPGLDRETIYLKSDLPA